MDDLLKLALLNPLSGAIAIIGLLVYILWRKGERKKNENGISLHIQAWVDDRIAHKLNNALMIVTTENNRLDKVLNAHLVQAQKDAQEFYEMKGRMENVLSQIEDMESNQQGVLAKLTEIANILRK